MKIFAIFWGFCALVHVGNVQKLDGRIIGGRQVDISDFPHQASVRLYDQHICGGTIINTKTVLTAGHCVYGMDKSQYSVRVGHTRHVLGQKYRVSQVIENRNYNSRSYNNDMAILKLAYPLTFSTTIQPIPLQPRGEEVASGTTAWVSGWGVLEEGSHVTPTYLRAVDVSVITNFECNFKYGGGITSHMMCAQTMYHDSCQGDSGGPLVANGKLIGVVSWGYGCARPYYPGIYSKVSSLHSWIIANSY